MPDRDRVTFQVLLAITLLWSLVLALAGSTEVLLFCAPALLLAVPLALGRFLGEERLALARERLARPRSPRRAARTAIAPSTAAAAVSAPRGGRLIAFALAKRPPPAQLVSVH